MFLLEEFSQHHKANAEVDDPQERMYGEAKDNLVEDNIVMP
jgi:hypothetical protein